MYSYRFETPEKGFNVTVNPLTPTVAIWVTAIRYPVPDLIKPSFGIFDIRAL